MDAPVALWILLPLAAIHAATRKNRSLLLFQLAVDVALVALPGAVLVRGLHLGPGAPGAAEWGGPVTVTGSSEYSDFPLQLAVWWEEVRRLAAAGQYPWISDRIGGGTPLFANGQTTLPFPLQLPVWVLGPERGTDVMAVWKLEAMALGGFLFLRRLRLLPAACAVGSLAYAFGLCSLSWLVSPVTWVMAGTPWVFWLLVGVARGSSRAAGGLALLLGVLAGWSLNPDTAAFLWLAVGVAGVVLGFWRWRRLRLLVAVFLLAIAVAGVGALPTLITAMDSPKAAGLSGGNTYPSPGVDWAIRARLASMLLTPFRYGHPAEGDWREHFPAMAVSFGIGTIAVCCLLGGVPRRRLWRWTAALGAVGALAVVLVWQLPGFASVLGRVPVLGGLVWVRAGFLVGFALAMLGGVGADAMLRRRAFRRFAVAALAVQLAVVWLALTLPKSQARRRSLELGCYPTVALVLSPLLPVMGGAALPALVLVEQCTAGAGLLGGAMLPRRHIEPRITMALGRLVAREPGRVLGTASALPANLPARMGFADLRSDSPARSLALVRLHQALGAAGMDLPGPVTTPWAGLAGAWNVRWLATPAAGLHGPWAADWEEVYRDAGGRLYRNPRALAMLRLASRAIASPGDPATGAWEGVDFSTTAVVGAPVELGGEGTVTTVEDRPDRHVARLRTHGTVLAVLHVPRAPGWRAFIDGRAAPIVVADLAAMGVVVGGGEHEVRWRYAPPGLAAGIALTLLGLAGCLAVSLSSPRRRR